MSLNGVIKVTSWSVIQITGNVTPQNGAKIDLTAILRPYNRLLKEKIGKGLIR